jgi:hypothetical protein
MQRAEYLLWPISISRGSPVKTSASLVILSTFRQSAPDLILLTPCSRPIMPNAGSATLSPPFGWTTPALAGWAPEQRYGALGQARPKFGICGLEGFSGHWTAQHRLRRSTARQAALPLVGYLWPAATRTAGRRVLPPPPARSTQPSRIHWQAVPACAEAHTSGVFAKALQHKAMCSPESLCRLRGMA